MNIAFPAFFIFILILPGFILQKSYEKVENTSIEKKPFDVSSSLAFFYALIVHLLVITTLVPWFGAPIDYDVCVKLLIGAKSLSEQDLAAISDNVPYIFSYFSSSFILAYVLGKVFQKSVFKLNPYKSSRFAFDTPWYYELKGQLSNSQNAELIKVSCLVESKNVAFLYYGVLEDFYLDSDGQLNRIVLSDAMRRPIELDEAKVDRQEKPEPPDNETEFQEAELKRQDEPTKLRFYEIKGDRLILKYEDIKNINIEYLYIYKEE